jgi:hypothetical protein
MLSVLTCLVVADVLPACGELGPASKPAAAFLEMLHARADYYELATNGRAPEPYRKHSFWLYAQGQVLSVCADGEGRVALAQAPSKYDTGYRCPLLLTRDPGRPAPPSPLGERKRITAGDLVVRFEEPTWSECPKTGEGDCWSTAAFTLAVERAGKQTDRKTFGDSTGAEVHLLGDVLPKNEGIEVLVYLPQPSDGLAVLYSVSRRGKLMEVARQKCDWGW